MSLKIPREKAPGHGCLPSVVGMVMGLEYGEVIARVGHQGDEVAFAGLPEPLCYRGFHPQEMIEVCWKDGVLVTQIDLAPSAYPAPWQQANTHRFESICGEPAETRFFRHMFHSKGWIAAKRLGGLGHALAYEGQGNKAVVVDPATLEQFTVETKEDTIKRELYMVSLFRCD